MSTGLVKSEQLSDALMHMVVGFWISQAIYAAAKLKIADQLVLIPKSVPELAHSLNANEGYLFRLLRALSSIGIFKELSNGTFEQTPMSHLLCSDTQDSLLQAILMLGDENYRAWGFLADSIKTGEVPFNAAYGLQAYEFYKKNPEMSERFNAAMAILNRQEQIAVAEAYDFSTIDTLVDVGGGNGKLLATILKKYPNVSGVLFELPQVKKDAQEFLDLEGIGTRCKVEVGDFFESVIEGGDAYLLSHIIHTFSDELCEKILCNVYRAMPANGKLLIIEDILVPGNDPATAKNKFMDLNMLVLTPGGREHTEEEFKYLLEKSGFRLTKIVSTTNGTAIIEGQKA